MKSVFILVLLAVGAAGAQDRVVSLQGFVDFDTVRVTVSANNSDTLYFSNVNAGFQKIDGVVGRTPLPSFNTPFAAIPSRVFNTGNNTLFFRSATPAVCDRGYVKVQPLLYDGRPVYGDSVAVGNTAAPDPSNPLNSHTRWRYVDLTSKFVLYNAIRVIISVGDCTGGWTGTVAYGRVR